MVTRTFRPRNVPRIQVEVLPAALFPDFDAGARADDAVLSGDLDNHPGGAALRKGRKAAEQAPGLGVEGHGDGLGSGQMEALSLHVLDDAGRHGSRRGGSEPGFIEQRGLTISLRNQRTSGREGLHHVDRVRADLGGRTEPA